MKQYKVLTQKDKWFSGKFDPELLEKALNSYASQGWRVVATATASIPGFGNNREELLIVMEREAPGQIQASRPAASAAAAPASKSLFAKSGDEPSVYQL